MVQQQRLQVLNKSHSCLLPLLRFIQCPLCGALATNAPDISDSGRLRDVLMLNPVGNLKIVGIQNEPGALEVMDRPLNGGVGIYQIAPSDDAPLRRGGPR